MKTRGYGNRSEAIRDLARAGLQQAAMEVSGPHLHQHHDLAQATLHVHLDQESCMEVTVLKGGGSDVRRVADHVIAERGVRHGHVVYLPLHKTHTHGATKSRVRSFGH